jgi:hypothetical protein
MIFPGLFGSSAPLDVAGTADEQRMVNKSVAPLLGVPADQVPSLATLLLGPMAR